MIREMQAKDVPEALELLRVFHTEMGYEALGHSFDERTVWGTLQGWLANRDSALFVVENHAGIVGIGAMMVVPSFMNVAEMKAVEVVWHTLPSLSQYRRAKYSVALFEQMESWARRKEARTVHFNTACSKETGIDSFLESNGYRVTERHYVKELNHGN